MNSSQNPFWNLTIYKNNEKEIALNISLPILLGIIFLTVWSKEDSYLLSSIASLAYLFVLFLFEASYYLISAKYFQNRISILELTAFGFVYNFTKSDNINQRLSFLVSILLLLIINYLIILFSLDLSSLSNFLTYFKVFSFLFVLINFLPICPNKLYWLLENFQVTSSSSNKLARINKIALYFLFFVIFLGLQIGSLLLLTSALILTIPTINRIQTNKFIAEFSGLQIKDIIIPKERLVCFSALLTSHKAVYLAINSFQEYFPVLLDSKFLGIVNKSQLIKNIALDDEQYLSSFIEHGQPVVRINDNLKDIAQIFLNSNNLVLPVLNLDDSFLGLIVKDKVKEFELIKSLETHRQKEEELEI